MLFYSKFYAVPFLFIFEIWVSYRNARKSKKVEVGKLKLLFLLREDAYLYNTTNCFYSFRNMQKAELCVL